MHGSHEHAIELFEAFQDEGPKDLEPFTLPLSIRLHERRRARAAAERLALFDPLAFPSC